MLHRLQMAKKKSGRCRADVSADASSVDDSNSRRRQDVHPVQFAEGGTTMISYDNFISFITQLSNSLDVNSIDDSISNIFIIHQTFEPVKSVVISYNNISLTDVNERLLWLREAGRQLFTVASSIPWPNSSQDVSRASRQESCSREEQPSCSRAETVAGEQSSKSQFISYESSQQRNGFERPRLPFDTQRSGFERPRLPIDTQRSGFERPRLPIDTQRSGFERPRLPIDTQRSGFERPRLPIDNQPQANSRFEQPRLPNHQQRSGFEQPRLPHDNQPATRGFERPRLPNDNESTTQGFERPRLPHDHQASVTRGFEQPSLPVVNNGRMSMDIEPPTPAHQANLHFDESRAQRQPMCVTYDNQRGTEVNFCDQALMTMMERLNQRADENMLLSGRFKKFSGDAQRVNFYRWLQGVQTRLEVNSVSEDIKLQHLLYCLEGPAEYELTRDRADGSFDEAVQYLTDKYTGPADRQCKLLQFEQRHQLPGESVCGFAAALTALCPLERDHWMYTKYMINKLRTGLHNPLLRRKAAMAFRRREADFDDLVEECALEEEVEKEFNSRGVSPNWHDEESETPSECYRRASYNNYRPKQERAMPDWSTTRCYACNNYGHKAYRCTKRRECYVQRVNTVSSEPKSESSDRVYSHMEQLVGTMKSMMAVTEKLTTRVKDVEQKLKVYSQLSMANSVCACESEKKSEQKKREARVGGVYVKSVTEARERKDEEELKKKKLCASERSVSRGIQLLPSVQLNCALIWCMMIVMFMGLARANDVSSMSCHVKMQYGVCGRGEMIGVRAGSAFRDRRYDDVSNADYGSRGKLMSNGTKRTRLKDEKGAWTKDFEELGYGLADDKSVDFGNSNRVESLGYGFKDDKSVEFCDMSRVVEMSCLEVATMARSRVVIVWMERANLITLDETADEDYTSELESSDRQPSTAASRSDTDFESQYAEFFGGMPSTSTADGQPWTKRQRCYDEDYFLDVQYQDAFADTGSAFPARYIEGTDPKSDAIADTVSSIARSTNARPKTEYGAPPASFVAATQAGPNAILQGIHLPDQVHVQANPSHKAVNVKKRQLVQEPDFSADEPSACAETQKIISETGKNPIMLVGEYASRIRVDAPVFEMVDAVAGFGCRVSMKEDMDGPLKQSPVFIGRTKRQAKDRSAMFAFDELVKSGKYQKSLIRQFILPTVEVTPGALPRVVDEAHLRTFYQMLANEFNKFIINQANFNARVLSGAKVTAGILIWDASTSVGRVVSFGTGTRTIGGTNLDDMGRVVNDSHAEILARRGFVRYLYHTLFDYINGEARFFSEHKSERNRLVIRDGISFHLYISSAPCGDGRLFTFSECEDPSAVKAETNQTFHKIHQPIMSDPKKHAIVRSKIEKGAGTIPVFECGELVQTLDGITGGDRLRTMSCSDKVLKWNVMGLQGTLLSRFIEPIYLSSIILGTLFHHGHLARAVCCRMSGIESQLEPYDHIVNHPVLAWSGIEDNTIRDTSKPAMHSTNYNLTDESVEFLDAGSGKPISTGSIDLTDTRATVSRLAKCQMFDLYKDLCGRLHQPICDADVDDVRYLDCKQSSYVNDYKSALSVFKQAIKDRNYGWWLAKPREEKMFK